MTWTRFMDMHSGGGQKLDYGFIYIEAPEDAAAKVFMHRFGRNPNNITCSCCGEDYSFYEHGDDLVQASGFDRHCAYEGGKYVERGNGHQPYISFQTWLADAGVPGEHAHLIIYANEIKLEELARETPRHGRLVWVED